MTMTERLRPAWVDVDLDAIQNNVRLLRRSVAPSDVCAVVKADAYGHGAVEVSLAAIAGGASRLAVALVEEGQQLRSAGISAPILVLSEPHPDAMDAVVKASLTPTLYSDAGRAAMVDAVNKADKAPYRVHVKVDTGMNRVGISCTKAVEFLTSVQEQSELTLEGVFTHFAAADEPSNDFTDTQGKRFTNVIEDAANVGIKPPLVHAANSAAGLLHPDFRFSFVRFGIAIYGLACSKDVPLLEGLRPALSVKAKVSFSKVIQAGDAVSYAQRYRVNKPTRIVTVPVGYADGVPRLLGSSGGEVLIGGKRRPIAGTVTMDQLCVDCGSDDVAVGDEVVLIGQQGDERISPDDWAGLIGTIGYEIVCSIGPRLPRQYHLEQ